MSFVRYFNCCILFLLPLMLSKTAFGSVLEKKCGKHTYRVKIINGSDPFETHFKLYSQEEGRKKILFYKTEPGIELIAACIQNKNNQELMLLQEFCGGNGCPEDIYGIFDPNTKKMLIKPSDWPKGNRRQVKKIIGYSLPSLIYDKRSFCCYKNQY